MSRLVFCASTAVAAAVVVFAVIKRKHKGVTFVPFSHSNLHPRTLVVDCWHPTATQITHHLKGKMQKALSIDRSLQGDSSTEFVLNVIAQAPHLLQEFKHVTSNHFDIDSFLSVWCVINPQLAMQHADLLCEVARIGDFRELELNSDMQHRALQLACWLNSEEKRLFYEPFAAAIFTEDGETDSVPKFTHFLREFKGVLVNPHYARWEREVDQVYSGLAQIIRTKTFPDLGLVVMEMNNPCHYYALFSRSRDYDIVVAVYSHNRYEVEIKYTTMVDLASRTVLPRVEMATLAQFLCTLEPGWRADRITDSGPILRIDRDSTHLTKAQRYGHPCDRPIYASRIPPSDFVDIVVSYFQFAYCSVTARSNFEWSELHDFNNSIKWEDWTPPAVIL